MKIKERDIEIDNVFYTYAPGNTFIAIWTCKKAKKQYGPLPGFVQVSFTIGNPGGSDLAAVVKKAVRAKVSEQRRALAAA